MSTAIATLLLVLGIPVIVPVAQAPEALARWSGTVVDPHGRGVPAVPLTLTHADTRTRVKLRCGGDGRFVFEKLAPGEYIVETEQPGFVPALGQVSIPPAADIHQDLRLQIAGLTQTVEVYPGPRRVSEMKDSRAKPDPCADSQVGGCVTPASKIRHVTPGYPRRLFDRRITGTVVIDGTVSAEGAMTDVTVLRSSHDDFTTAVLAAIQQDRYVPFRLGGTPIPVRATITYHFRIGR